MRERGLRYCTRCVMPDSKPYITFDAQGVCSACTTAEKHAQLAADRVYLDFEALIQQVKDRRAGEYDVLVPVSGGKDSITQVHRLLHRGLRILAVNVEYGPKTDIGIHNLNCIPQMGANLIIYKPEQKLHTRLIRLGFLEYGDPDLLSHCLLHAYPMRLALRFGIPLVFLGENSAIEYSGASGTTTSHSMTYDWFLKYAANNGMDARFVAQKHDIPLETLQPYDFPLQIENNPCTQAHFASCYFPWDSEKHLAIARQYGFKTPEGPKEGTYRSYVGLDEVVINRVHQYFKVLKFGYGRATDHACEDIRRGYLTREEAIKLVSKHDLEDISEEVIHQFCTYIDISRQQFVETLERFRNPDIWKRDTKGRLFIPGHISEA